MHFFPRGRSMMLVCDGKGRAEWWEHGLTSRWDPKRLQQAGAIDF